MSCRANDHVRTHLSVSISNILPKNNSACVEKDLARSTNWLSWSIPHSLASGKVAAYLCFVACLQIPDEFVARGFSDISVCSYTKWLLFFSRIRHSNTSTSILPCEDGRMMVSDSSLSNEIVFNILQSFSHSLCTIDIDDSDNGKRIDPTVSIRDTWTGEITMSCLLPNPHSIWIPNIALEQSSTTKPQL